VFDRKNLTQFRFKFIFMFLESPSLRLRHEPQQQRLHESHAAQEADQRPDGQPVPAADGQVSAEQKEGKDDG